MGIKNISGIPVYQLASIPENIFRSYTAGQKIDIFRAVYRDIIQSSHQDNNIMEIIELFYYFLLECLVLFNFTPGMIYIPTGYLFSNYRFFF